MDFKKTYSKLIDIWAKQNGVIVHTEVKVKEEKDNAKTKMVSTY